MMRKILALFIALTLCGTARADLFYYGTTDYNKDFDNITWSFGRITENSSGTFQKGPALKSNLHRLQMFSPIKYKGHDRLVFTDSDSSKILNIRIYNPNDLDTPVTSCDVSSLNFYMGNYTQTIGPKIWGNNLLFGGGFQYASGGSGIIEVNPETGKIVNSYRYPRENSSCYEVVVCGNKIYTSFHYTYSLETETVGATDYSEMSSLGVITDQLKGLDFGVDYSSWSNLVADQYNREIVLGIGELDGKLYAGYQIQSSDFPNVIECGLMRFDSNVDASKGYKAASFKEKNSYINSPGNDTFSGSNNGFVIEKYNGDSNSIEIYLCDGSGSAVKIHTISPYMTYDEERRRLQKVIGSMYYEQENGRIFFTVQTSLDDNILLSNKLVVLSKNSDGSFSVSQEIDGIGRVCFVESFSGSDSHEDNNTPSPDDKQQTEPETPDINPSPDNGRNTGKSSGGGGCSTFTFTLFAIMLCPVILRKK